MFRGDKDGTSLWWRASRAGHRDQSRGFGARAAPLIYIKAPPRLHPLLSSCDPHVAGRGRMPMATVALIETRRPAPHAAEWFADWFDSLARAEHSHAGRFAQGLESLG